MNDTTIILEYVKSDRTGVMRTYRRVLNQPIANEEELAEYLHKNRIGVGAPSQGGMFLCAYEVVTSDNHNYRFMADDPCNRYYGDWKTMQIKKAKVRSRIYFDGKLKTWSV